MGLFVYTQKGSIISMVVLPTTEIIEPIYLGFKVRKVPKAERLPLDVFDEFIGRFQLSVGIWKLHGVCDVRFIL